MANKRISELNSLDGNIDPQDLFLVQDVFPVSESKHVTWGYLSAVIAASSSAASASYSAVSDYSENIVSSSWASASVSSSYASAGSGSGIFSISSSYAASASYCATASVASGSGVFAITSSYSFTSSYSSTGSTADSASYSVSCSFASGSNVFSLSGSYALSASHALTASTANYAVNGIETGYMILFAGIDSTSITQDGSYLSCNGQDVPINDYKNLYNVIGNKFGNYPELSISASRRVRSQTIKCFIGHDSVNIYGNDLGTGVVTFYTQSASPGTGAKLLGLYTVTSLQAGKSGSSQILREGNPTVSFTGLGAADYKFIITEQNTNTSLVYPVSVKIRGTDVTQSFDMGPFPVVDFTAFSNVAYSSKFDVIDQITDQTSQGQLIQTAPSNIISNITASLILPDNQAFNCNVFRYSGSYNNFMTASLRRSTQILNFSGVNSPSLVRTVRTFSSSFFVPNVNVSGSLPENRLPSNAVITSSGYPYAFKYLIKT